MSNESRYERGIIEAGRRRTRAALEFDRRRREGEMLDVMRCGYCGSETFYNKMYRRQHLTCVMCGAQMIAERVSKHGQIWLVLTQLTCGPPAYEWNWGDF